MHHRRVQQEKNVLIKDMKRLKKYYDNYEPVIKEWKNKYELVNKEKMLITIERDRIKAKLDLYIKQNKKIKNNPSSISNNNKILKQKNNDIINNDMKENRQQNLISDSIIPNENNLPKNPYLQNHYERPNIETYSLEKTYNAHKAAIASLDLYVGKNNKAILATVSDDYTWKLWSLPTNSLKSELIMSGDGHTDWISGVSFHPKGSALCTASGDGTVKLWSFNSASCIDTYTEHNQPVWDCDFHYTGDFIISGSMDQTARLYDIQTSKNRQTFRGHVDSVNTVQFLPYGNLILTGSGDKTLSLWDIRNGRCINVIEPHDNAVLSCSFNYQGNEIISSDVNGLVSITDLRKIQERLVINTSNTDNNDTNSSNFAINTVKYDASGELFAIGGNDGLIKIYDSVNGNLINVLEGHNDSIQTLIFHPKGKYLISGGSDATFRIWR